MSVDVGPEIVFLAELFFHKIPVDEVPEGVDIVWTAVAEVDVIGMLPDVEG